jgi:group I intron endonuclease
MHYLIYKTTCLTTGKIYIGKHQTSKKEDLYLGSGLLLKLAIKKYGRENFSKEILFEFSNKDDMNAKEKELVTEEFCSREDTYNIAIGGQGGNVYGKNHPTKGTQHSEIHKKRISDTLRKNPPMNRPRTEEEKSKISAKLKGKPRANLHKKLEIDGKTFNSHKEAAEYFNVAMSTITHWKKTGKAVQC